MHNYAQIGEIDHFSLQNIFIISVIIIESFNQGFNARKVISEVYASFVLQCTVTGRKFKHKTDVEA